MIQLAGAGKRYGPKLLFENADWLLGPKDRIGLVGANGTGKSTLLRILSSDEGVDYGSVHRTKGISVGTLPQQGLSLAGRTVFAECLTVFDHLRVKEEEMRSLMNRMAELDPSSSDYAETAERYHQLESEFRNRDGYALEARVGAVLAGLGFPPRDWERRTEEFSGGWQMRIALAKLLLEQPNLLLLDEPTNHLDLEARNWLEDYLSAYPHAFVVVSHDRYFLDVTVSRVVEVWNRGLHFYAGNYSRYLEQKTQRREQLEAAWRNQQERIQQLEAFINRFRYQATKAKQVQSRIKELERMERVEIPDEEKTIHFSFPQPKPSGRVVAEFQDVSKRYGEHLVFGNVRFVIERGERIALVGVNGAGKSTLIRLLAGMEEPSSGVCRLGHNVQVEYFAQDQYKVLNQDARILDELASAGSRFNLTELRNLLGCFLFSEDDVFKPIGVLSGGERNRFALARLLVSPSNFLLLDEPTNHLDMRAKDVLLAALEEYSGTVVFVSHDRFFIDRLATRVFEVQNGHVEAYPGNYEDYLWRLKNMETPDEVPPAAAVETGAPTQVEEPATARGKRLNPIRLRQLKERCEELERMVDETEARIGELEAELAVFRSAEHLQKISSQLESRRNELETLLGEWEQVTTAIGENEN